MAFYAPGTAEHETNIIMVKFSHIERRLNQENWMLLKNHWLILKKSYYHHYTWSSGSRKNVVKAMNKNEECFRFLKRKSPRLSEGEIDEGVF